MTTLQMKQPLRYLTCILQMTIISLYETFSSDYTDIETVRYKVGKDDNDAWLVFNSWQQVTVGLEHRMHWRKTVCI
jgi:hypothetical protein